MNRRHSERKKKQRVYGSIKTHEERKNERNKKEREPVSHPTHISQLFAVYHYYCLFYYMIYYLLIRSANNSNISEEDLYRVGNIFLYTISNLDIDGVVLRDVIQNIRESMVVYNTNQVFSVLDTQITSYNNYLDTVRLATETQLEERVQEFHQEVDQRIALNRRRVLYAGVGLLGSMALSSFGMPLVGDLIIRSLTSNNSRVSSSTT